MFRCPVCKSDLVAEEKRYICANNHAFDIARQGYVNLLLSSQRPSKAPGDSAEMIADRRAFLDTGHYQPLRERVLERLAQLQQRTQHTQQILDLGCGEGYYTAAFARAQRTVYALDISKPALAIAARRTREITWCIGTSRALPFHDRSLDVVINIFCRPHVSETQRVLREHGTLLLVGPGAQHLRELRDVLYDNVKLDDSHTAPALLNEGFTLAHSETLHYRFTLEGMAIGQLARMTPHYWRAPAERRALLDKLETLTLQAEFIVQEFQTTSC
jgi:23S rRNA (guanine745-N1)-methyltransferase